MLVLPLIWVPNSFVAYQNMVPIQRQLIYGSKITVNLLNRLSCYLLVSITKGRLVVSFMSSYFWKRLFQEDKKAIRLFLIWDLLCSREFFKCLSNTYLFLFIFTSKSIINIRMLEKDSNKRMDSIKLYERLLVLYSILFYFVYRKSINHYIFFLDNQTWLRYIGIKKL